MVFGAKKSKKAQLDESRPVKFRWQALKLAAVVAGGLGYAAALAPLNCYPLAFLTFIPLLWSLENDSPWRGFWHAWLWGMAWSLPGYWFLREIEPAVPFGIAVAVSVFCGVFGAVLAWLRPAVLYPENIYRATYREKCEYIRNGVPYRRQLAFIFTVAMLYTLSEWSRSRLFPWNDLAVTQYRNRLLLQTVAWWGGSMLTFVIVFVSASLYALWRFGKGYRGAIMGAVLLLGAYGLGLYQWMRPQPETTPRKLLLIQGDLSQRRHPKPGAAEEALEVYCQLTNTALKAHPDCDLVVWPECAVPIVFDSFYDVRRDPRFRRTLLGAYQQAVRSLGMPLLFGALDFAPGFDGNWNHPQTNSAFLIDRRGDIIGRYDKCHRVPFGEYVPFRRYLPEKLVKLLDMGRDLAPGATHIPLEIPQVGKAGMMICFESVFSYIARSCALDGADFLLVISNDAWYPTSSEPEQHLANAVLRAVESGLPMVRCGNNGGSLVVTPRGEITQVLTVPGAESRPELRRGRGFREIKVGVAPEGRALTPYCRIGELPQYLLIVGLIVMVIFALNAEWKRRRHLADRLGE